MTFVQGDRVGAEQQRADDFHAYEPSGAGTLLFSFVRHSRIFAPTATASGAGSAQAPAVWSAPGRF